MDKIEVFEFDSGKVGEHLIVLGAIHGDEICGTKAIREVISDIEKSHLVIEKGKVTFIPVCNPKAYEQNLRYIDRNLNRYLFPKTELSDYEDSLTNQLCPYLETADVLLDLHSYQVGGAAFIFIDRPEGREFEYAKALGAKYIVYGWSDSYGRLSEDDKKKGMGTTEYLRQNGGFGVTMECGQHLDPISPVNAKNAIHNAINYLNIAQLSSLNAFPEEDPVLIRILKPVMKSKEGKFTKDWKNFEIVKKGSVLGVFEDGEQVVIPEDGVLILPKESSPVGSEWSYLGQIED